MQKNTILTSLHNISLRQQLGKKIEEIFYIKNVMFRPNPLNYFVLYRRRYYLFPIRYRRHILH